MRFYKDKVGSWFNENFRNTALVILAAIFLNIAVCSIIETNAINTSTHNLRTAMTISSQYALDSFQITQFSGFDDNLGSSYDISDSHNKNAYLDYLNSLQTQATSKGFTASGSDFQSIIDFLKDEVNSYDPSNPKSSVLAPFAFNWTFLEERRLENEFASSLNSIINANYNPSDETVNSLVFSGKNILRIKSAEAKIVDGPKLVNLADGLNPNNPLYKTYLQLFGSKRAEAANMINGINSFEVMYNYVITYDVVFTVEWEHHTITPFFNSLNRVIPSQYVDERGQIVIDMQPMVITKKYAILN